MSLPFRGRRMHLYARRTLIVLHDPVFNVQVQLDLPRCRGAGAHASPAPGCTPRLRAAGRCRVMDAPHIRGRRPACRSHLATPGSEGRAHWCRPSPPGACRAAQRTTRATPVVSLPPSRKTPESTRSTLRIADRRSYCRWHPNQMLSMPHTIPHLRQIQALRRIRLVEPCEKFRGRQVRGFASPARAG